MNIHLSSNDRKSQNIYHSVCSKSCFQYAIISAIWLLKLIRITNNTGSIERVVKCNVDKRENVFPRITCISGNNFVLGHVHSVVLWLRQRAASTGISVVGAVIMPHNLSLALCPCQGSKDPPLFSSHFYRTCTLRKQCYEKVEIGKAASIFGQVCVIHTFFCRVVVSNAQIGSNSRKPTNTSPLNRPWRLS